MRMALATCLSTALMATMAALGGPLSAQAQDYPTWDDVRNARADEQSKQAEVSRIQSLLDQLRAEVVAAQALAQQRGEEYQAAQLRFDTADYKAQQLNRQAEEAQEKARRSNQQAGALAAQLVRTGGSDVSVNLFASGGGTDRLLYQLGTMSKLTEKTREIYEQAQQDRNTAQSLTDQARLAAQELEGLATEAKRLADEATAAQQAVEQALAEQAQHEAELAAQLAVLTQNREATEADYQAGVAYRNAQAAAAAAAAAAAGVSWPTATGWASPFPNAHSTDEFGYRVHPISGGWIMHSGLDLGYNGGTCGATVFAAKDGTVTYAGWNGGYGIYVQIDHGDGWSTAYGHNSQLLVQVGERVDAGQPISYAGTTGNSTGCHLHYEVRKNGSAQDPRAFMAGNDVHFG